MDLSMMNEALGGMDPAEVALGAGFVGVILALVAVAGAAWFFISAIGYFKMFKKAGQRGWFAFIPFLREYAMFKMSWTLKAFIVNTLLLGVFQLFGESEAILPSLAAMVCGIVWVVMQVKLLLRVAKSFGKGKIWAVLLFFVPFIATLILGFGSAEYLGNPEVQKEETAPGEL